MNMRPFRVLSMLEEWRREVQLRSAKHAGLLLLCAIGALHGRVIRVGDLRAEGEDHADVGRMLVVLDCDLGVNGRRTEEEVDYVRATVEGVAG
jgi:hypothetical protein